MTDIKKDGSGDISISSENPDLDKAMKEVQEAAAKETEKPVPEAVTAMMEKLKNVLKEVKDVGGFRVFIMIDHAESGICGMMGTIPASEVATILTVREMRANFPSIANILGGMGRPNYKHPGESAPGAESTTEGTDIGDDEDKN